jgi:hypothetical protein
MAPACITVEAVNVSRGRALLSDGSVWPILRWFGWEGDEGRPFEAVTAVARTVETGDVFVVVLSDYVVPRWLH